MPYSLPEYRGEYKMEGRLGESGTGPVYLARDNAGHAVAIKVLTGPLSSDPDLPDRLRGEANLKHKNILTIVALFRNKDRICIVTELLEGKNLRDLIAEDPALSLLDRIEIMTQAAEALRYAHANGLAHRGLKPSHIHIQSDGTVKVRNFSLDLPPEAAHYMPPERVSGNVVSGPMVDALCNIFTYGVILNELTGNSAEHPALLTGIIQRALNKDRALRYQSFEELLADLARLLVLLRKTDLHFTGLFESFQPPDADQSKPANSQLYENVQFTVYRPRAVRPGEWKSLLAFAHLSERPADAPEDEPDPIKDVQQRANQMLGKDAALYQDLRQDSTMPIPHEGELTFVPHMNGIEFNPRRVSFLWQENVHQAAFRLRASPQMDGQTARGQMCVYLGSIIVAQVALRIEVNSQRAFRAGEETLAPVTVARYRRIFASYSHRDVGVVEEFERYGRAMGDEYLRDVIQLRSGEAWNDRLLQMIEQANVFQLFWSSNSIRSPYVRQEWQYALKLNRDFFVRPVYWEDPLPEVRELNLPPDELRSLHFHRVIPGVPVTAAVVPEPTGATGSFAVTGQAVVPQAQPGDFTRMFQLPEEPPALAAPTMAPDETTPSHPGPPPLPSPAGPGAFTRSFGVPPPVAWKPPSVPTLPSSYQPPRQSSYEPTQQTSVSRSVRGSQGLPWLKLAAAVLILVGVGGVSWYGLRLRKGSDEVATNLPTAAPPTVNGIGPAPEPQDNQPAVNTPPQPNPPPVATPVPQPNPPLPTVQPTLPPATPVLPPPAHPQPANVGRHYTLMLWSRGMPILPDQVIRGADPFLQSSFTLDGSAPSDASIEVQWYLNGVSSGVTDFDPADKGKHKSYLSQLREGNYRAVLLVDREAVASLSFSYQK